MTRHSTVFAMLTAAVLLPLAATAADTKAKVTPAAKIEKGERQCSMPTSPRLQKKGDDCSQSKDWARSYSNEELNSTGQSSSADALRRLDARLR